MHRAVDGGAAARTVSEAAAQRDGTATPRHTARTRGRVRACSETTRLVGCPLLCCCLLLLLLRSRSTSPAPVPLFVGQAGQGELGELLRVVQLHYVGPHTACNIWSFVDHVLAHCMNSYGAARRSMSEVPAASPPSRQLTQTRPIAHATTTTDECVNHKHACAIAALAHIEMRARGRGAQQRGVTDAPLHGARNSTCKCACVSHPRMRIVMCEESATRGCAARRRARSGSDPSALCSQRRRVIPLRSPHRVASPRWHRAVAPLIDAIHLCRRIASNRRDNATVTMQLQWRSCLSAPAATAPPPLSSHRPHSSFGSRRCSSSRSHQ